MNEGKKTGAVTLLLGLVLAAALIFTVMGSGFVDAAKPAGAGGRGGHKGGNSTPPPSTAACSIAPDPAPFGSVVTINGSGFWPNYWVGFSWNGSMGWTLTDSTGHFSTTVQAYLMGTNTANITGGGGPAICTVQTF